MTVTNNRAEHVTGIARGGGSVGKITLSNSVVAGNVSATADPDCGGTITSAGYNLIGNKTNCKFIALANDHVGTAARPINPRLLPLGDNGGPTFTHAPAVNSPVVNEGNPAEPGSGADACLVTDQRGVARPGVGTCDIGAYEQYLPMVTSVTRADASPTRASSVHFTVRFSEAVTGIDTAAPLMTLP